MEEVDIAIIGAGVVGLAVAKEVARLDTSVAVLERNKGFGQETSSRNSEVIHAGMYYPTGTLKARLCVEGRRILYELCEKHAIPHRRTGKLIVAVREEEKAALQELYSLGQSNGVEGLVMFDASHIRKIEPNVAGLSAMYSAQTGIVDSHRLMQYFADTANADGAIVSFNSEVIGIEKMRDGYKLSVKNNGETLDLKAQVVVNSAGLDSDTVAAMAGTDVKKFKYELRYCKGQYFRVAANKSGLIKRLVYPVPMAKSAGLGIHATLDLSGSIRLGPDDAYLEDRNKDYSVDNLRRRPFYESVKKIMPFIEEEDLTADTSGIRPKLQGPGEDFRDFVIQEEKDKGLEGFINLIGIESPGLTACLAIARHVKGLIKDFVS